MNKPFRYRKIGNMNLLIDVGPNREISASPGVDVKSSKATRAAFMTRLMLAALAGLISAFAAICTTVLYSTVFGWRNFWLGVCVAGFVALVVFLWMACKRS